MKILMVCLGNICRSPLAEGIMKKKITENGLNWEVDSAGTSAWHIGHPPDPRSILVAAKYNIDISQQSARQIQAIDLENFDLIFAMDHSNYENILKLDPSNSLADKVKLILSKEKTLAQNKQDVPDPYWDDNGFEHVYQLLNGVCETIIQEKIKK